MITYTPEEIEERRAELRETLTATDLAVFIEDTLCGVYNTDTSALDHACIAELLREAAALHDEKAVEKGGVSFSPPPPAGEACSSASPIQMRIHCPARLDDGSICGALHVDEGEFATKRHHTHSCQSCGHTWRPAVVATVGVRFLPGFKNADPPETPAPGLTRCSPKDTTR